MHPLPFHHFLVDDIMRTVVYVLSIILFMEMAGSWWWRVRKINRQGKPIVISNRQMITLAIGDTAVIGIGMSVAFLQYERLGYRPVEDWYLPVHLFFLALACLFAWRRDYHKGLQP